MKRVSVGSSKVIYWRWAASVAWSLLLLPVCTALFVLLSRVSLLHPIVWISGEPGPVVLFRSLRVSAESAFLTDVPVIALRGSSPCRVL